MTIPVHMVNLGGKGNNSGEVKKSRKGRKATKCTPSHWLLGWALPGLAHITYTTRGMREWGYLYTNSHTPWAEGSPRSCLGGSSWPTSGLPHNRKVGFNAQREPSQVRTGRCWRLEALGVEVVRGRA